VNTKNLDKNAFWRFPLFSQSTTNLHGLFHPIGGAQVVHQLASLRTWDVKSLNDIINVEEITIEKTPSGDP